MFADFINLQCIQSKYTRFTFEMLCILWRFYIKDPVFEYRLCAFLHVLSDYIHAHYSYSNKFWFRIEKIRENLNICLSRLVNFHLEFVHSPVKFSAVKKCLVKSLLHIFTEQSNINATEVSCYKTVRQRHIKRNANSCLLPAIKKRIASKSLTRGCVENKIKEQLLGWTHCK